MGAHEAHAAEHGTRSVRNIRDPKPTLAPQSGGIH